MKWIEISDGLWKNKNGTMMKAKDFDLFPVHLKTLYASCSKDQEVIMSEYGTCSVKNGKSETSYPGILMLSEVGESIFQDEYIKPIRQKTSMMYLSGNNMPLYVKNKNYHVIISPCCPDDFDNGVKGACQIL